MYSKPKISWLAYPVLLFVAVCLLAPFALIAGPAVTGGSGGGTTVDSSTDLTIKSLTVAKQSGVAGDIGLYEANSTDVHAAGFRGPASITGDGAYRGQLPNARPSSANMVLAWTNAAETGTGTAADPYVQATSWADLDNYVAKSDLVRLATFFFNGGGSAVTTGATTKICMRAAFTGTITKATIKANQSTTTTAHLYKDAWATGSLATTDLTGGTDLTVTGTLGAEDSTLTSWTKSVTAGDEICAECHANNNALWFYVDLFGTR